MQKEFRILCVALEGNGPGPAPVCGVPESRLALGQACSLSMHLLTVRCYCKCRTMETLLAAPPTPRVTINKAPGPVSWLFWSLPSAFTRKPGAP